MRIGIISAEYPPAVGGVGDHSQRLARALAALGHSVDVVSSRAGSVAVEPEVCHAVGRWDWRILPIIGRLARRRLWDVVHVQYQPAAYGLHPAVNLVPLWLRATSRRTAVVTTFHDLQVPYLFPKAGALRRLAVRQLARSSSGVIAVAEEDLGTLAGWVDGRVPGAALAHVPLGNQIDAPPPPGFDRAVWRARIGVSGGAMLVGHLGFVNRSKAVDELIRAVWRLVAEGRDVHLLMIGEALGTSDPTNRAYLEGIHHLIDRLELEPRVHWTGFETNEHLAGWLRCIDLAALPFRDGASLRRTSLIAAWAAGAPVLTSVPGYAAPWLRPGEPCSPAATVRRATAAELTPALADLLDRPTRRAQLRAAGERFAGRFSWPHVIARTVEVYQAALAAGR